MQQQALHDASKRAHIEWQPVEHVCVSATDRHCRWVGIEVEERMFYRVICHVEFSFDGVLEIFFVLLLPRSFFTTNAVSPPVEVAPATISATVVRHAGHIALLLS